jgi:hypothetical protein
MATVENTDLCFVMSAHFIIISEGQVAKSMNCGLKPHLE